MSLTYAEIRQRLIALGEAANEIADDCLNYGGCCVFAGIVATRLEKLGVQARGVVATYRGYDVDAQRPKDSGNPYEWNSNGLSFNHVGLEIVDNGNAYVYDSAGLVARQSGHLPDHSAPIIPGYLSVEELVALGSSADGWNCTFNRDTIPLLEKAADSILLEGVVK